MNFFAVFLIIGAGTFQVFHGTSLPTPPTSHSVSSWVEEFDFFCSAKQALVSPKSVLLVVVGGLSFWDTTFILPKLLQPPCPSYQAREMKSRETGANPPRAIHRKRAGSNSGRPRTPWEAVISISRIWYCECAAIHSFLGQDNRRRRRLRCFNGCC